MNRSHAQLSPLEKQSLCGQMLCVCLCVRMCVFGCVCVAVVKICLQKWGREINNPWEYKLPSLGPIPHDN